MAFRPVVLEPESTQFNAEPSLARFTWVNFKVDTIRIKARTLHRCARTEVAQIRSLILMADGGGADFELYRQVFSHMNKLARLDVEAQGKLRDWDRKLDACWGISEDAFAGVDGWTHPEVRIIETATGDVMNYANEERWIARFVAERWEHERKILGLPPGNGEPIDLFSGPGITTADRRLEPRGDRRRPRSSMEEPVDGKFSQLCNI